MQPGTRLDHYEIIDKLGEGGMGAVYRAQDTNLRREVAIKVLPPEVAADPERLARLEREAQLLASLNHPNLATVHGFGSAHVEENGAGTDVAFLVMELIEGESLYDRVQMGPMPWRDAVEIGIGIAAGLEAAHERGIVHRDLKPANVHLAADGTVKVLDFGLAKAFEGDGASGSLELSASPTMAAATRTGVILGTAAYMSPEQARGQTIDKRADIWALGCVLFELLGGRKAFDGGTVSDILASILKEHADLDRLPPIPPTLRHLLERCLEKDPARRMRDVGDVRLELEAARTASVRAADAGEAAPASRKLVAAVGVIALAAGLAGGWLLNSSAPPSPPQAEVLLSASSNAASGNSIAVSPDGRWVAEADIANGIRLRAMNELGWRNLENTGGASAITFSADNTGLYFTRGAGAPNVSLHRVEVSGTSPVLEGTFEPGWPNVTRDVEGNIVVSRSGRDGTSSAYRVNRNGTSTEIFSAGREAGVWLTSPISATHWLGHEFQGGSVIGLVFIDLESSGVTPLLPGLRSPRYLGNGRLLAVDAEGRLVSARIDPDTGEVLEAPVLRIEGLNLWLSGTPGYDLAADGTLVYLSGVASDPDRLLGWLDMSGTFTRMSERAGEYFVDSFVSPDGTMLVLETTMGDDTTIAIHDIERDVQTALVPGGRIAFPVWSPDSRHVIYRQLDDDGAHLYRAPIDRSTAPEHLLAADEGRFILPMSWSPDGTTLLYVDSGNRWRNPEASNALWLLPLDGSDPQPFLDTEASETDGRFSPDGNWVAYQSDQTGNYEIYVRPLAGGGEFKISADGGREPEWNPAGGQLFFISRGSTLTVADIDLRGATPIVSPERELFRFPEGTGDGPWAPAPDGERFLATQISGLVNGSEGRSLLAIFNWSLLRDWK